MSVAQAPQPAAGAESWGPSERRDAVAAARRVGPRCRRPVATEGLQVSARVPHAPRAPRGHAETAQRGVSSWRSEIGPPPSGRLPAFLLSAGLAPVDASRNATRGVSQLR